MGRILKERAGDKFLACEYEEICVESPDPVKFLARLIVLHLRSTSPTE